MDSDKRPTTGNPVNFYLIILSDETVWSERRKKKYFGLPAIHISEADIREYWY